VQLRSGNVWILGPAILDKDKTKGPAQIMNLEIMQPWPFTHPRPPVPAERKAQQPLLFRIETMTYFLS